MNILIYGLRLFVIALACGCWFASFRRVLSAFGAGNRFLAGFCSSVLLLPLFDYLLALIWPGIPGWMLMALPPACAAGILIVRWPGRGAGDAIRRFVRGAVQVIRRDWNALAGGGTARSRLRGGLNLAYKAAVAVALVALAVPVSRMTAAYFPQPVSGNDETHYLMQARYFAQDRQALGIDNYTGDKAGTVLPDDHGPLWPVYLGDALLFAGPEARNSPVLRLAEAATAILMLAMLAGVAGGIMGWNAAWIAVAVALVYRNTMHFPLSGSRDGFRFVALLLYLMTVQDYCCRLCADRARGAGARLCWSEHLFLMLATCLCMNGHGGNAYLIVGPLAVLACACVGTTRRFSDVFFLGLSTLAGVATCLVKNALLYLRTGKLRSYTSDVYKGTPALAIVRSSKAAAAAAAGDPVKPSLLVNYTLQEKGILLFAILVFATLMLCCAVQMGKRTKARVSSHGADARRAFICGLLFAGLLLPLTGCLNFIAGNVQAWFFQQLRYRMYIFIACGLLVGVGCAYFTKVCQGLGALLAGVVALISLGLALSTTAEHYPQNVGSDKAVMAQVALYEAAAREVGATLKDGCAMCNDQVLAWYLEAPPKLTVCDYAKPLYQAVSGEELAPAIDGLRLRAFVFDWRGDQYCREMPFYAYLNESGRWERRVVADESGLEIEVFYEKEHLHLGRD